MDRNQERESVWQASQGGFESQLERATRLEQEGGILDAACLRATAYYSHYPSQLMRNPARAFREFRAARSNALTVAAFAAVLSVAEMLSHGQYDVVGTVLLRGWLWVKPEAEIAIRLLLTGRDLPNIPPHSKALMTIGVAEARYMLERDAGLVRMDIAEALGHEYSVLREPDQQQAWRQFCRVLRRAFTLAYKLGDREAANSHLKRAQEMAVAGDSPDQLNKIKQESLIIRLPRLVQALLPY